MLLGPLRQLRPRTPACAYLALLDVEGQHLLAPIAIVGQLVLGHGGGRGWGGHTATTGKSPQPLRPKVEGLRCHCGAGRVPEVGGEEQGRGYLAFTLQTPKPATCHSHHELPKESRWRKAWQPSPGKRVGQGPGPLQARACAGVNQDPRATRCWSEQSSAQGGTFTSGKDPNKDQHRGPFP